MAILTDNSKSVIVTNSDQSTKKKYKKPNSRNLILGRRATPEKILSTIVELSKTHTIAEIVEISGKSDSTVKRYLKKGKSLKVVNITEGGRVTQDEAVKSQKYSISINRNEIVTKYPKVEKWTSKRIAEAKGDKAKLKNVNIQLGCLKIVCDTVKINPIMILAPDEDGVSYGGLENVMSAFAVAMVEGRVVYQNKDQSQPDPDNIASSFRVYVIACRNFAMYSGVAIPRPMPPDHILSGKKIGFGQYAHIKMTQKEINQVIEMLSEIYGKDSMQVAMICFYYITGTRQKAIYPVKTSTVTTLSNGWLSCRVYESKQRFTWKKYIPNEIYPHFEILRDWIVKRQKDHKEFLFSETGMYNSTFDDNLKASLKEIFEKIETITDEYFFGHATHCWRHVSAHWWKAVIKAPEKVCKIVGWKDIQTYISCYGETTDEEIFNDVVNMEFRE